MESRLELELSTSKDRVIETVEELIAQRNAAASRLIFLDGRVGSIARSNNYTDRLILDALKAGLELGFKTKEVNLQLSESTIRFVLEEGRKEDAYD